jgi:hypothetical protein
VQNNKNLLQNINQNYLNCKKISAIVDFNKLIFDMLHIFQAGERTDRIGRTHKITVQDLEKTVQSYDPKKHQAPLLRLHNENQAAGGLVAALKLEGDKLLAIPEKVDPQFQEDVTGGKFPRISAAFYPPDAPNNPSPGNWYLRHVAFVPNPAVKGLDFPQFADASEFVEFMDSEGLSFVFRNLRDWLIDTQTLEIADRIIPDWVIQEMEQQKMQKRMQELQEMVVNSLEEPQQVYYQEKKMDDTSAAKTQNFADREAQIAQREAAIAKKEAELKALEYAQFADTHLAKITPANRNAVVEIMAALGSIVEFSEGVSPLQKFKDFVSALPDRYSIKPAPSDKVAKDIAEFSEADIAEMSRELVQIQQKHGVGPLEALQIYHKGENNGSR